MASQVCNNNILLYIIMLLPKLCFCGGITGGASLTAKATFYGSKDHSATPTGACGYGEYGKVVNNGEVCGVSTSKLYKNGTACGACYQVKCKNEEYCNDKGAVVVVTDSGGDESTEFILSYSAYLMLAKPLMAANLIAEGKVDIEYERVPCIYPPGFNLLVKVHESSKFSSYLAIVFLNQGGISDITAVEVWEESEKQWKSMVRAYGAVWAIVNPPKGAMKMRFQVRGNGGVKWVQSPKLIIPTNWKAGILIDTFLQIA